MTESPRLHRCKTRLRKEKKINEELGRRVGTWKKKYEQEKTLRLQHAERIADLEEILLQLQLQSESQKTKTIATHPSSRRLPLPPLPSIVERLATAATPGTGSILDITPPVTPQRRSRPHSRRRSRQNTSPPSFLRSVSPLRSHPTTPVREQDISISLSSPEQCTSPRWSTSMSTKNDDDDNNDNDNKSALVALTESLRSSHASHLVRSVWRNDEASEIFTQQQRMRHQRPAASAFFVTGPIREDLIHCQNMDEPLVPKVLHSVGRIEIEDSNEAIPPLVERMCFPNGISIKTANVAARQSSSVCRKAPISLFCMSVAQQKRKKKKKKKKTDHANDGDDEDDESKGPTALYGICASFDPSGTLAVVEHKETGTLVRVPLIMCILTYEPSELRSLAATLHDILRMEEERVHNHLHLLRCGKGGGGSGSGVIHGNSTKGASDATYGKLGMRARERVTQMLQQCVNTTTSSNAPLLPCLLPLFEWGGSNLFKTLTSERVLVLLGCAMTEQKIIFVSKHTSRLGASVLAFVSLLSPMTWCGPLIPILPSELEHILDAPFPLIAGVTRLTPEALQQRQDDAVIVNLDKGRILLPTSVNSSYHSFKLPHCDRLSYELTAIHQTSDGEQGGAGAGLVEMTRKVKENVLEILKDVKSRVPSVDGEEYAQDVEVLMDMDPFLAKVAGTQMCSHWRQLQREKGKENDVRRTQSQLTY